MAYRGKSSFCKNQNFDKIRNECLKNSELFCDEYFKFDVSDAVWLRPREICEEPRFFVEGMSRCDVIQGENANCWLIVAMANLTTNETLFHRVVPKDQSFVNNYTGAFRFKIWQCGEWVEVVVDDRLPTRNEKLIFVQSKQKNVFWSALLEKAYAKLYGSYSELSSGWFGESMVDFTGGIVETLCLAPVPLNLEKVLISSVNKHSFICVFMKDDPNVKEKITGEGLVKGHAYSITKVQYLTLQNASEKIFLIRLRNPWGKIEWTGAWSDSSSEWTSISHEEKSTLGLLFENDGEFWMSLSDFTKNFKCIDICHLSPGYFKDVVHGTGETEWEENSFRGEWIKGVNAGGVSRETIHLNPQFRITLSMSDDNDEENLCTLIIALMQKNKTRRVWHRIGYTVFKLDQPGSLSDTITEENVKEFMSKAMVSSFKHRREIVVRSKWAPGVYCIIPSTQSPNLEGQFFLRVFTEKKVTMVELEESPTNLTNLNLNNTLNSSRARSADPVPEVGSQEKVNKKLVYRSDPEIKSMFSRIAGKEKVIGWQGLQSILQFALTPNLGLFPLSSQASTSFKFPKFECRTLIAMLDDDRSGDLDFDEFETLWGRIRKWESIFLQCSQDTNYIKAKELKQALTAAGYHVPSTVLGSMLRRFCDREGRLTFDDFVMCAVELQTS